MDIVAGILEILGTYLVGNKSRICFMVNMVAHAIWIYYATVVSESPIWGLVLVCGVSMVMNIRAYIKWGGNG